MTHVQISEVESEIYEIAIRGNSLEFNKNSNKITAVRVADKSWGIVSSNRSDRRELIKKAIEIASKKGDGVKLAEAKLASGDFKFKRGHFDEDDAIELVLDIERCLEGFVEVILTYERVTRKIETNDGANAVEKKELTDLNLSVLSRGVASVHIGGVGGLEVIEDRFEFVISEVSNRAKNLRKARLLNPLMRGMKTDVILTKECACAFVHEVVHNLEADVHNPIEDGFEITVYDRPLNGFGSYHFDDEGVLACEKCLIEDGVVKNLLHTRETAFKFKSIPMGNGRGLYTIPKAFQSNLYVEKGSWKLDEMIEETREGFLVEGLVKAEIQGDTIYIYPEICWYVKREIVCPVIVNAVKIPVKNALKRIKGDWKRTIRKDLL